MAEQRTYELVAAYKAKSRDILRPAKTKAHARRERNDVKNNAKMVSHTVGMG